MELNRREFLLAGASVALTGRAEAGATLERPFLRVGILSDEQGMAGRTDWGFFNFENALRTLAKLGVDVLVNAGDIVDMPRFIEDLSYVQDLERRHFGDRKPVDVACLGNHELGFEGFARDRAKAEGNVRRFCEIYGYPPGLVQHVTVRGFDFISCTCYEDVGYDGPLIAELRAAIEKAVRRDAEKPVFVVTHFHPSGTVLGGDGGRGRPLRELFNGYPQIVSLSGHSHSPLQDERCIWQGEFTAVETSTLSYGCLDDRKYANCCSELMPWGRESVGFNYLEIFADRMVFRRYQADDAEEMKPGQPWIVRYPYDPAKPQYGFASRKAKERAPRFANGTPLLLRYDFGFLYFIFDQAAHPDLVHRYRLVTTEIDGDGRSLGPTERFDYLGNFYRYARNRDRRFVIKVPPGVMAGGRRYRAEVFPVATFGTEGEPLVAEVRIRDGYNTGHPGDRMVLYPQE